MRQTTFKAMTVTAALFMSFALPYSTHANLDESDGLNKAGRTWREMPAALPVAFLSFPGGHESSAAGLDYLGSVSLTPFSSIDDSRRVQWPNVDVVVPRAPKAASADANVRRTMINLASRTPASVKINVAPDQLDGGVDRIRYNSPVLAPMAFMRFCVRYPHDCAVDGTTASPVELTNVRRAELAKVNRDVNRAIVPEENTRGLLGEEWHIAPRRGDCVDYAVTKRHELLARGWPAHSLLLAEVIVASGEHHLILVVRTREEDLVLDNLSGNVHPLSEIHYQLVRAQQVGNPKFWSAISIARPAHLASR